MQLKVQAGNRNGDHQFPGLWDGRRTVLNAGVQPSHGLTENSKWKCHYTAIVPPWYTMIVLG